ncbi:hypothetical protein D3C80_1478440 [compost metagenome]
MGHQQTLPGLGQVADDFLGAGIDHRGADRHRQGHVFTLAPGAVLAATVLPALGIETAGVAIIHQGVEVAVGLEPDRAAVTAVAAIRTTIGHEFFAAKTHAAVATVTGLHMDGHFIDEFHG